MKNQGNTISTFGEHLLPGLNEALRLIRSLKGHHVARADIRAHINLIESLIENNAPPKVSSDPSKTPVYLGGSLEYWRSRALAAETVLEARLKRWSLEDADQTWLLKSTNLIQDLERRLGEANHVLRLSLSEPVSESFRASARAILGT